MSREEKLLVAVAFARMAATLHPAEGGGMPSTIRRPARISNCDMLVLNACCVSKSCGGKRGPSEIVMPIAGTVQSEHFLTAPCRLSLQYARLPSLSSRCYPNGRGQSQVNADQCQIVAVLRGLPLIEDSELRVITRCYSEGLPVQGAPIAIHSAGWPDGVSRQDLD